MALFSFIFPTLFLEIVFSPRPFWANLTPMLGGVHYFHVFRPFWSLPPPRLIFQENRSQTPPEGPKGFSEASGPIAFFGKIEKFELVKKKSKKKSRQRSSTVVTHNGPSQNESTFATVEPQRVAAVVARSALQ